MHADETFSLRTEPRDARRESSRPATQQELSDQATEKALRELLTLVPTDSFTHYKYARFLMERQRAHEAAAHFREALQLQPDYSDALRDFAALLTEAREYPEAIDLLRRAIVVRPDDARALCDLGNALVKVRHSEEAVVMLQQALRLAPHEYKLHSNLGVAFMTLGRFSEAERSLHEALRLRPMFGSAHNNLGNLYFTQGRLGEALACFELAGVVEPGNPQTPCNRGLVLLAKGEYEQGWADYQMRWQRPESPHRPYEQPLWNGESPAGKRILVYTEEGLGDRIHFIRYARFLKELGARVLMECPMPLLEVFQGVQGIDELIPMGEPLPEFDLHVPLLSLPHIFKTTVATIPAEVPYLHTETARVSTWRAWLEERVGAEELRIGIAWQGNPNHQWDAFRSMPLMAFEPLLRLPGVRLVSLQRGPGVEQIDAFQRFTNARLLVPTDGRQETPGDLAESAAILANLDLIVTVDTATAHLAGALGRAVWVMLSTVTDWRWMRERADSPWYPTMRLFRQKQLNEWDELMARLTECVRQLR